MKKYLYYCKDPESIYSYMDLLVDDNHYYIKGRELLFVNYRIGNPTVVESVKNIERLLSSRPGGSPNWELCTAVPYARRG